MRSGGDAPPTYAGAVAVGHYREWRWRTELWSLSTKVVAEKRGARLVTVLEKAAWDATRHLTVDELTSEDGKTAALEALDLAFAEADDVSLIESADEYFYQCCRSLGEDIVSFRSRLEAKLRRLEAGGNIFIPDETKGFVLSKQAGMSPAEIREMLTLTHANRARRHPRAPYPVMPGESQETDEAYLAGGYEAGYENGIDFEFEDTEESAEGASGQLDEDEAEAILMAYQVTRRPGSA
eukprot:6491285-Amphidinium_carterae.4